MQSGRFAARCLGFGVAIWLCLLFSPPVGAQSTPVLTGATQYGDQHAVTRTLQRFEELVRTYYGKPVDMTLRRNAAMGLERQYLDFMSRGTTVDYAIVSMVHLSILSRTARLIEAPFLFRDAAHWEATLASGALKPFEDEIATRGAVMIIGYAGGSVRNLVATRPAESLADLKAMKVRVPGAPLWREGFEAAGMTPVVTPLPEIFGALRKDALVAAEGNTATIETAKLYEAAPYLVPTAHAIAIRPICMSAKAFKGLPPDLQEAILKAGTEAAAYGRQIERADDEARLAVLEQEGRLKRTSITDRAQLKTLADPVIAAYAKEIGAEALLGAIEAAK